MTSSWQKLSRVIQKFGTHISSVESQTITSQISLIHGRSHLYWACHSITVCLARQLWLKIMTVSAVDVKEIHLLMRWTSLFLGMLSKREKIWLHNMIYWKLKPFHFTLSITKKNTAQVLWNSVTKTCLVLVLYMLASPPGCWPSTCSMSGTWNHQTWWTPLSVHWSKERRQKNKKSWPKNKK